MQVSLNWLKELVDLSDITVEQIAHELTMSGLEVEEVEELRPKFTNIITAKIEKIDKPILFHITLTPYLKDIEPNVIPKGKIINAIKKLSGIIGKENIYVRYDPIFINDKYSWYNKYI